MCRQTLLPRVCCVSLYEGAAFLLFAGVHIFRNVCLYLKYMDERDVTYNPSTPSFPNSFQHLKSPCSASSATSSSAITRARCVTWSWTTQQNMKSAYWATPSSPVTYVIANSPTLRSSWSTRKPTRRRHPSSVQSVANLSASHQSSPFIEKNTLTGKAMLVPTVANRAKQWHCWSITVAHTRERGRMFAKSVEIGTSRPKLCRNIWSYTCQRELKESG